MDLFSKSMSIRWVGLDCNSLTSWSSGGALETSSTMLNYILRLAIKSMSWLMVSLSGMLTYLSTKLEIYVTNHWL